MAFLFFSSPDRDEDTRLELVVVRVERRHLGLETLADTDVLDHLLELRALLERSWQNKSDFETSPERTERYSQPFINSQWSITDCGNAWPEVAARSSPLKPNDSMTGRYALTVNMGVPTRCSSEKTWPRRLFKHE